MGVHLEEPTSPGSERWSDQLTSPVKSQWTDEDLDAFVRQLSNPQHQVTRVRNTSGRPGQIESPRKRSVDLSQELKDRGRVRAPLTRSETDASSCFGVADLGSPTFDGARSLGAKLDKGGGSGSGGGGGGGGLISGLSGLRLIKNKKLVRSSQVNVKKSTTSLASTSSTSLSGKLTDGPDATTSSGNNANAATSASSPEEGSDGDLDTAPCLPGPASPEGKDVESNGAAGGNSSAAASSQSTVSYVPQAASGGSNSNKEPVKKRRFRRFRPLNRSQSAGCGKDVPAYTAFIETQRSKDAETISERQSRSSDGDIQPVRIPSGDEEDLDLGLGEEAGGDVTPRSEQGDKQRMGRIHKTKSADAAMMASEDFGAISVQQPKPKSRNIAKKITRKMQFLRRRHTDSTLGAADSDGDGARRLANIPPDEAKQWSKSFSNLLYDKTGLELFRGFLMSEHSDENIEFWIACENYKTIKNSKQLLHLAHKIYNDYVAVQSNREVNLDSKTRTMTGEGVSSNPNRQTFDEAQRRVQALMEKDSYRRFLESELYHDLVDGNLYHKSS